MGANMARRLKDVGYTISAVYDARPEAARQLAVELGAEATDNPLFPFPDRPSSVFSALGEKANS